MTNDDTKCRKMEEELNCFWPQWHVDKYLGGNIFGDVFRIYRSDSGLKMVSALNAIQINDYSMAGMEQMQPYSRISCMDESDGRTGIPEVLAEEIQTMELLRGAPNVVEVQDYYYKKNPGTISHVAPEIFTWSSCNNTVDIYALGLVLYQLLNGGRMPFLPPEGGYTESDIDSANFQRLHEIPVPPLTEQIVRKAAKNGTAISHTNAERLDKIIRKACEADPSKRFQSAGEFYEALNGYSQWPGERDLKDASEKPQEQQTNTSPPLQNPKKDETRMRREEIIERWKAIKKTEGKTEEKVRQKKAGKPVRAGEIRDQAAEYTGEGRNQRNIREKTF